MNHDARISALEENGGGSQNGEWLRSGSHHSYPYDPLHSSETKTLDTYWGATNNTELKSAPRKQ